MPSKRLPAGARRSAGDAVLAQESMFRDLFEAAPDAIVLVGRDGTILLANAEAHRVFGHEQGTLVGSPLERLMPSALRAAHEGHRDRYFDAPRARRMGEWFNLEGERRDGTVFPVDISLGPFTYRGQPAVLSIVRDTSERKKLEQALHKTEAQLLHAQKMQAVGTLAGGVAHDFNNLLSVILSYANLVLESLDRGDSLRGDIEEIQRAGQRAEALTRQLLAFSRQQVLEPSVVDLNHVLSETSRMMQRMLGPEHELSLLPAPRLARIYADRGQLERVLLNLVVNARDAMPGSGRVSVETANVHLDAEYAAAHAEVTPGRYVMLAVTDTGTGMDAATRDRIFEPFFTTKEVGKGTGLGLSTVYGIVKQMGGHILVYSEVGHGTTFKLYFPETRVTGSVGTAQPPALAAPRGGTETVLLVDDDEPVRTLARTVLARNGYRVLEAQNAGEAFLLSEKLPARIHLLLTDVVMPRVNGLELAARLTPQRPDMKVLYMSGYTESSVLQRAGQAGLSYFQKPITPSALLSKVRAVLDASDGAQLTLLPP